MENTNFRVPKQPSTEELENQFSAPHVGTSSEEDLVSMDQKLLNQLEAIVLQNLNNDQFSVEQLASEVAYSRSHLHRKLQQISGKSISHFIRSVRLDQAMILLKAESATVSEIAYKVGFGSSTYFIKCFTELYGFSPGEVKKRQDEETFERLGEEHNALKTEMDSLEFMHPAASETLIEELFRELATLKPSLEKFLTVDEDEGEKLDVRLLAYQMIKSYPWPIAVELRRLFSANLAKPNQDRIAQINNVIEAVLKLCVYSMLSDLIQSLFILKKSDQALDNLRSLFANGDASSFLKLLQLIKAFFKSSTSRPFIDEVSSFFDEALEREITEWSSIKENDQINLIDKCANMEQTLAYLLKKSAFLIKYKLVKVEDVSVHKSRFKDAYFRHFIKLLNSADSDFQSIENIQETYSDSHTILLMKSLKNSSNYLNLSPFLIDTHTDSSGSKPHNKVRQDLYMLHAFSNEKVVYKGTDVNQLLELQMLPNAEELGQEFDFLFNLISVKS